MRSRCRLPSIAARAFSGRPATVPSDFVTLYGDAWPARLIYGAAYLSALEWKLGGRDPASCLYPIGATFNALLRDLGQSTFPEFP